MRQNDYRVIPEFLSRALSGKSLNIYKPGTQTRTFCYSTDALNGFLRVLVDGVPGEPYNIGNDYPEITISELAEQMEIVLGRKIKKTFVEHPDVYPSDEPVRRCPDLRKASIHLAYQPTVALNEGLRRSINWASEHYIFKL
jgi:UDP-glucuronate decarboxylase